MQQAGYRPSHKNKLSTFKNNNKDNKANYYPSSEIKGHCDHQITIPNILPGILLPWPSCICERRARLQASPSPSSHLLTLQWLPMAQVANLFIFRRTGVWLVLNQVALLASSWCIAYSWNDLIWKRATPLLLVRAAPHRGEFYVVISVLFRFCSLFPLCTNPRDFFVCWFVVSREKRNQKPCLQMCSYLKIELPLTCGTWGWFMLSGLQWVPPSCTMIAVMVKCHHVGKGAS